MSTPGAASVELLLLLHMACAATRTTLDRTAHAKSATGNVGTVRGVSVSMIVDMIISVRHYCTVVQCFVYDRDIVYASSTFQSLTPSTRSVIVSFWALGI